MASVSIICTLRIRHFAKIMNDQELELCAVSDLRCFKLC